MRIFSLLVASILLATSTQAHDIVLRDQGKAILGISYPSDWKQVVENSSVIATSEDGQAWSVISTLDEIQDQAAGIEKIKAGLEDYLKEIEYDETTKSESGSLILSGTAKGKKTGVDVVFTSAVFMSGARHCGLVFIVDADIEKYYEKTVLAICESILVEDDFVEEAGADIDYSAVGNGLYAQPWLVEDIAGQGVVDRAQTTIQFSSDGKVAGDTSVNRYQGQAKIDGAKIDVGPLATTRRAGPQALMDQETKFLKAIESVKSFRIEPTGLLFLLNESGDAVLRLSPMDATNRK
jgi:heat shock protein HslJ